MNNPISMQLLEKYGRTRLSKSFYMRDFLYSEIAAVYGIPNVPEDWALAEEAGSRLCQELLEPIQEAFGRIAIRSAYRSQAVNQFGNENGLNCASNEHNYAKHIWDKRDKHGRMGAMACIVVPSFWDRFQNQGDWQKLGWWIHDQLAYSTLFFFPQKNFWACNVGWREDPERRIDSYAKPVGCLTKPGMNNHEGSHEDQWRDIMRS